MNNAHRKGLINWNLIEIGVTLPSSVVTDKILELIGDFIKSSSPGHFDLFRIKLSDIDAFVVVNFFLDGLLGLKYSELSPKIFSDSIKFNNFLIFFFVKTE